jgi:phospholipid/cholesterol/gamma-HCH transport system substrate-binding protein
MVGLFVITGLIIGVVAIVWLGAAKYFQKGARYVTYFDESVQGLQVDSRVKYRGVEVGNVERIGVAPDQRLVEVVVKIDLKGDVEHTVVTQLRAAGITGIVFVELDRRHPDEESFLPPTGMATLYPVIPSQPSQTKQMLSSIDRVMENINQVDLKGISDQIRKTSRAVETFFVGQEMTNIIKNLDSTTVTLEHSLRSIERILAEGKINSIMSTVEQGLSEAKDGIGEARKGIGETREGIEEIRTLLSTVRKEVEDLKAAEIAQKSQNLIEGLDKRTRAMAYDIQSTTDDIRQAVDSFKMLIESLRENPSDLFFSEPVRNGRERKGK